MRNIVLLFTLLLLGCNKPKDKLTSYDVISKIDAEIARTDKALKMPIIPQELKWYSNIVFVMDSSNVYIYQTVQNQDLVSQKIKEYDFPNFIGLKPEQITTIPEKDFLPFIKANNDVFEFINKPKNRHTAFYIASFTDTIKNKAYYDLFNYLQKEERTFYKARIVTEEEMKVIECKIGNKKYTPEKIKWSNNFILGKYPPFSKEYVEEEKNARGIRKAIETFKRNSYESRYYE